MKPRPTEPGRHIESIEIESIEPKGNAAMTAIHRLALSSLAVVLVGALATGCSSSGQRTWPTPEVIPTQVCGGDADSDGDGVTECNDRCPGTIRGEAVDTDGCPLPIPEAPKPFRG